MILDLSALCSSGNAEEEIKVHIGMDTVESKMGAFPIIKKEPFTLHLKNVENRRLLIQGETDVTISVPCDRCLADVSVCLRLAIDKCLSIPHLLGKEEDDLEQVEYMNGCQLDADRLVYEEILFLWPAKVLCAEDCKGICAKCGANLNESDCGCDRTVPDPRMAAFQDVFNKFKEV